MTGVPEGETITFSIRNMNNQGRLYKMGLKPVFKVVPDVQLEWQRIPTTVEYDYVDEGGPFYITYSHEFKYNDQKVTYFAFKYPFSFEEI